jgi:hypothetical protein
MDNIIVNVNSIFRDTKIFPSSSKFTYNLPSHLKNIIHMRLTSLEIPNTFYTFSTSKNNVKFKITRVSTGFSETVTITDGNYTSTSLINVIQDELDRIIIDLGLTNLDITIDTQTAKVSIVSDEDITIDFTRSETNEYPSIKYFLGFNEDVYTGTSFTGESIINIVGVNYFFIKINNIQNIYDEKVSNAFAKIITNSTKFSVQFEDFENFVTKDKQFRSPKNFSKLDIELVDYLGNTLDLGNQDISFTLEFGYIYDINLYKSIHNNGIPNGDDKLKYLYNY